MAAMNRRRQLRAVAAETKYVLPAILSQLPNFDVTESTLYKLENTTPLDPKNCPGFTLPEDDAEAGQKGTRIRVYDQDSFDTALQIQPGTTVSSISPPVDPDTKMDIEPSEPAPKPLKPVVVLNLASEKHPGGGWQNGALAQEEALCFRSSLYFSLKKAPPFTYYPLPTLSTIYSPSVLLIRNSIPEGHKLLPYSDPSTDLPVTSVISTAGLRHPAVTESGTFEKYADRQTTKHKIRLSLRVAASHGHTKIVLGAIGCGVFGNPPGEVAKCFLEVFREEEFQGGWWEDVVFAVLDNAKKGKRGVDGDGNLGVFYRVLDGEIV